MITKVDKASTFAVCLLVASCASLLAAEPPASGPHDALHVDHRCAPPWWVTSICLPDDPYKTLIDSNGELLYDFPGRFHQYPRLKGFGTTVRVVVSEGAHQVRQTLDAPRVPIVRTEQAAPGLAIVQEAFAVRLSDGEPISRNDVILVSVTNTGDAAQTIAPYLIIKSEKPVAVDVAMGQVNIDDRQRVISTLGFTAVRPIVPQKWIVELEHVVVAPKQTRRFAVTYCGGAAITMKPKTLAEAQALHERAAAFWQSQTLPYGRITVPDPRIQALLDASIRNIWQAREIKNGLPAFQVGPSVYRGLWVVDAAFILETAAILGAGDQARAGIEYMISHQQPDGSFQMLTPKYYKENGIVLWVIYRHARLMQDRDWLSQQFPMMQRTVQAIQRLRKQTYHNDNDADDGLIPPGDIDGGLWNKDNKPEYSNVYWNLIGLRAAVDAARWLGKDEQVDAWQREFDDFLHTFRAAAKRDMQTDSFGNAYLPIMMNNYGNHPPQKAQWTFCHALYPGQFFAPDEPFVRSSLAMLRASEQDDMVVGTGWVDDGVWVYFASFYGHAWLWQGDGRKAARCLYAMANHASPTLTFREELNTRDRAFEPLGDMPHNWASAEFVRLASHLLAFDRGDELHLLEGLPREWIEPGMTTRLDALRTPFGTVSLTLDVNEDGSEVRLVADTAHLVNCQRVVVHPNILGLEEPRTFAPGEAIEVTIPISR